MAIESRDSVRGMRVLNEPSCCVNPGAKRRCTIYRFILCILKVGLSKVSSCAESRFVRSFTNSFKDLPRISRMIINM